MMLFWTMAAAVLVLAGLWLALPFLRRTGVERDETDSALSIYRDQADEVHRDLASGLISEAEFDSAQQEIEARALRAARNPIGGMSVSRRSPVIAGIICLVLAGGTVAGYVALGAPDKPDMPLAAREDEQLKRMAQAGHIESRIALLLKTVEEHPDSFEDWWLLARSYASSGDHASAADAYRRAVELSDNNPGVLSAYAETMTLANGNKVPQAARLIFEQLKAKNNDPRARYYIALARAQAQDFDGALNDWAALAAESRPDAPWMALVRRDIVNMARFTGKDVKDFLPDASEQEIAKAGNNTAPSDKDAMVARAVTLDGKLAGEPSDYKGWLELAQIRVALGEDDKAAEAIAAAKRHFAAAPFILTKIDNTAAQLGLDLLETATGTNGPTSEDIAAAQTLTAQEQAEMIDGMVAGLAAKLEENPDNPDGWVMLVRSYVHLGKDDQARDALETAIGHFSDKPQIRAALERELTPVVQ